MKKLALFSLLSITPLANASTDLVLPGEKWVAKFDKFICAAFGPAVQRPEALEKINLSFEKVTTDSTLDNALIRATFEENGVTCRYNAILFADNAAQTSTLVQSIAYVPGGDATTYRACLEGKALLDGAFEATNPYLYYGHPHNLAFMMPGVGAEGVCGAGQAAIGANFVVTGRIR